MTKKVTLGAIVLTYNEEIHLDRCLSSLKEICSDIIVVDSFSTDSTVIIAEKHGARVFQNPWVGHAQQLNWAILNTSIRTDWVMRVDADEYLDAELQLSIVDNILKSPGNVIGFRIKRLMFFLDKPQKRGGMYPIWHLRVWKIGTAICEEKWMDERMLPVCNGEIIKINGNIIDYNLNGISWWINKHNGYATREAIDILDYKYSFSTGRVVRGKFFGTSEERRRWLKSLYLQLPLFVRPLIFFLIRYVFQFGFLEGKRGFIWAFLQCFWYRFLVDVKLFEIYRKCGRDKIRIINYINVQYKIDILNQSEIK